MLAKAYSVLRGSREKEEVPLDDFFLICAPLIGVIPPNQYQQLMGWTMSPPSNDDRVSHSIYVLEVQIIDTK